MRIAGEYSFNNGKEEVSRRYPELLLEVSAVIKAVDSSKHKLKESKEKTMPGRMLYSPVSINEAFKLEFGRRGWKPVRVPCTYPTTHYLEDYKIRSKIAVPSARWTS